MAKIIPEQRKSFSANEVTDVDEDMETKVSATGAKQQKNSTAKEVDVAQRFGETTLDCGRTLRKAQGSSRVRRDSELDVLPMAGPEGLSRAAKNWAKVRMTARTLHILNTVNHEMKVIGKEVDLNEDDLDNAYKEILENSIFKKNWYIILPRSTKRKAWESVIVLLLLYVLVAVPIRVCFDIELPDVGFASTLDLIVDFLFIIDIIVNCVSAYVDVETNSIVVDQRKILAHYAKTWLILDLIASVPFHVLIDSSDAENVSGINSQVNRLSRIARLPRVLRLAKLLRLLKLLRLFRMMRYVNVVEHQLGFSVAITRLLKVFVGVFIVTHFIGCLWFLTSWVFPDEEAEVVTWVERYDLANATLGSQYLASVYWAFSTLTTVGFGDISATTDIERGFAVLCMVMGVSWYAFIISTFSSILNMFDRRSAKKRQNLSLVIQFMRDISLPWPLRNQILHHVEYTSNVETVNAEKDLPRVMDLLSTQLQTELLLHIHRNNISAISFFRNKTPQFIVQCVRKLKPMYVKEGEYIYKKGQHCKEMYFLKKGRAMILLDNFNKKKLVIYEGSFFGETGCLFQHMIKESVKAVTSCDLLMLSKEDLLNLMNEFPEEGEEIKGVGKQRLEKFKEIRQKHVLEPDAAAGFGLKQILQKVKNKTPESNDALLTRSMSSPVQVQESGQLSSISSVKGSSKEDIDAKPVTTRRITTLVDQVTKSESGPAKKPKLVLDTEKRALNIKDAVLKRNRLKTIIQTKDPALHATSPHSCNFCDINGFKIEKLQEQFIRNEDKLQTIETLTREVLGRL